MIHLSTKVFHKTCPGFIFMIFFGVLIDHSLFAQPFLSNLHASQNDPLFTTYAAPISRSEYKTDQAYSLMWYDGNRDVRFESKDGGNFGLFFRMGKDFCDRLKQFYTAPVITTSYSDIVKLFYYPFRNIKVEITFDVYSSRISIMDVRIINESDYTAEIEVFPYFQCNNPSLTGFHYSENESAFAFNFLKKKDNWMIEHDIPVVSNFHNLFMTDLKPVKAGVFKYPLNEKTVDSLVTQNLSGIKKFSILAFGKSIILKAGESISFRIIRGLDDFNNDQSFLAGQCKSAMTIDLQGIIREDENIYSQISDPHSDSAETNMLYWSAFNLMRQCMMPAEGMCKENYYVFSREPKWGWGYGGQVFHESLSMLAYMYMDSVGAMNSQRVFMERQHPDGYINYRTGPYLDETIETHGQLTTSAPWFSYENLEIYHLTRNRQFLKQSFESGDRLFHYFINNRDSDHDGLCEWGGDAVLESVRDARVAIWDKVGDPSAFESLDLNVMLVKEAASLLEMARELGIASAINYYTEEITKRTALINKTFWDEKTGFYYHADKKNQSFSYKSPDDLKIKEIIGFLPLWAGVADKQQAERLMDHLLNKDEFWRDYGIPTLSADHPYYNPMGYWNGPVWVQWDYLIFRGMIDYGYHAEALQLCNKITDNMINELKIDHNFWEFYSPDDHQAGWNKTYIWAGIVARMILDSGKIRYKMRK
ncbi:MAG: trehalase family glycosidase [Bacteroidia bacterium]|nr:trehalase family glycosidase [Bacteroidia bacterium]